jgi:O-glycosyl hydrolase
MHFLIATLLATAGLVSGQTTVTITPASTLQQIDGFGVSQAFGRASQFQALSNPARQLGLDYLFSTTTGAGLSIIRNRIGSGGSGDSIEPVSPGTNTSTPSYVWDGVDAGQVWFSQQAMGYGVKTIYADAWSAPGFMKTTGTDTNGGYLCGVTGETCTYDWREAYASFLLQYVKFYAQTGIPVTHLGFLNEPELV